MKEHPRLNLEIALVINIVIMGAWSFYYIVVAKGILQFALFFLTLFAFILSILSYKFTKVTALEFKKKRVYPIITMSLTLAFIIYLLAQILVKHGHANTIQIAFVILMSLNLILMLFGTCTRVIDGSISYKEARKKNQKQA